MAAATKPKQIYAPPSGDGPPPKTLAALNDLAVGLYFKYGSWSIKTTFPRKTKVMLM